VLVYRPASTPSSSCALVCSAPPEPPRVRHPVPASEPGPATSAHPRPPSQRPPAPPACSRFRHRDHYGLTGTSPRPSGSWPPSPRLSRRRPERHRRRHSCCWTERRFRSTGSSRTGRSEPNQGGAPPRRRGGPARHQRETDGDGHHGGVSAGETGCRVVSSAEVPGCRR
jgi:hypothetical protein